MFIKFPFIYSFKAGDMWAFIRTGSDGGDHRHPPSISTSLASVQPSSNTQVTNCYLNLINTKNFLKKIFQFYRSFLCEKFYCFTKIHSDWRLYILLLQTYYNSIWLSAWWLDSPLTLTDPLKPILPWSKCFIKTGLELAGKSEKPPALAIGTDLDLYIRYT